MERNRFWILVKYFPAESVIISPYYTLMRLLIQGYGMLTHKGAAARFAEDTAFINIIMTVIRSYISAFRGLPEMLKKRREISQSKKITTKEFKRLLKENRISCREISLKD